MMSYKCSISKEEINQLPLYRFEGTIKVIESEEDALIAAKLIKNEKILGFDTETKAAFKKGESYNVSLLQLATKTHAYLFRLNKFKLITELAAILSNPNIVKAGVAVRDDIKGLQRLCSFEEEGFVDLAKMAQENKIKTFGLRPLTALILKKRLSKNKKISNWEVNKLSSSQVIYAACDAAVGFQIYQALCGTLET